MAPVLILVVLGGKRMELQARQRTADELEEPGRERNGELFRTGAETRAELSDIFEGGGKRSLLAVEAFVEHSAQQWSSLSSGCPLKCWVWKCQLVLWLPESREACFDPPLINSSVDSHSRPSGPSSDLASPGAA